MAFTLNDAQVHVLGLLVNAKSYAAAYRLVASWVTEFDVSALGVSAASIVWIRGAANVNESIGFEASLIRALFCLDVGA